MISRYIYNSEKVAKKNSGGGVLKLEPPPTSPLPPPLQLDPYTHQSKALDVRIPNI